ncbi:hemerythrin domain-containing protein [Amycolatopsis sp. NPDC004368]
MTAMKTPVAMTRELQMVHTGLVREFVLMPTLLAGVTEGDRERAELVSEHITLLTTVLNQHHGEDLEVSPRLLDRGPAGFARVADDLERHHERIAYLSVDVIDTLSTWRVNPTATHRAAVLAILGPLIAVLREHLHAVLTDVFPLPEQHTGTEWDTVVGDLGDTTTQGLT